MDQYFPAIREAAREARVTSTEGRAIEILVTEIGWVIRGGTEHDRLVRASEELEWSEFESNPALLVNAVRLVNARLDA